MLKTAVLTTTIVFMIGLATALAVTEQADQNKGAEEIVLPAGSKGDVQFPHLTHQNNVKDCNVCHELFPQEKGAIVKLKADGKLKRKQVMNTQCLKCHREKKREGVATGPTSCSKCHQ